MTIAVIDGVEGDVERPNVTVRQFRTFDAAVDFAKLVVPDDLRILKVGGKFELHYIGSEGMM